MDKFISQYIINDESEYESNDNHIQNLDQSGFSYAKRATVDTNEHECFTQLFLPNHAPGTKTYARKQFTLNPEWFKTEHENNCF